MFTRRNFLATLGGFPLAGIGMSLAHARAQSISGSTTVNVPGLVDGSISFDASVTLPPPEKSGIEHIVVVMMENRSFDHFFGWLPGADGKQIGLTYTDNAGIAHETYPLAPDYTGCGHPDPDHSYGPDRVAYDGGKMDGFLRAGSNDIYAIGYYTANDLPFHAALAHHYTVCDRYFAAILGPTFPNRMFQWAAQTDRLDDSTGLSTLPTIFDSLTAAGISHQYYFNNLPYLALWGQKYVNSSSPFAEFLAAAQTGTLPAVSFVDPIYTVTDDGTGNDDHPHADIRNGDAFLANIFHTLTSGPAWKNTVLIINFDEWGGFFEHVAPPRVVAPNNVDPDLVNGKALLGFRVPTMIVSPFTKNSKAAPLVSHTVFDHTSVLKLIEWRFGLKPLTARDASPAIGNPAAAMNFSHPDSTVPDLPDPLPVVGQPCPSTSGGVLSSGGSQPANEWAALAQTPSVQQWLQNPRFATPSA